jgi:hypothetical protein
MATIVHLEDFRRVRSTLATPEFSNFWVELSMAVLNGWLKASIRHLQPSAQVIRFATAQSVPIRAEIA